MKSKKLMSLIIALGFVLSMNSGNSFCKADTNNTVGITCQAHVQSIGWQNIVNSAASDTVANAATTGTEGKSLRMEALKLNLTNAPAGAYIKYQAHVQNIGWMNWVNSGSESAAGTEGKSLRMEALKIKLENMPGYSIRYKAHVQNIGWQDWVSDGQEAGTHGQGLRVEALQIAIVKTSDNSTVSVSYLGHVQNIGWETEASQNGQISGTEGQGLRIEAFKLNLIDPKTGNALPSDNIKYQTHVQNIGWQKPVTGGQEAGTHGQGLRVEAIKIALENMSGYSIQYRAHVQNIGWQPWVSDGAEAGTDGKSLRVEAIEVRIVYTGKKDITPVPFVNDDSSNSTGTKTNTETQPNTKSMNTNFALSNDLNNAMGKTKTPTGTTKYNDGSSEDVFNGLSSQAQDVAIQLNKTDDMEGNIKNGYQYNNGGLYTSNGKTYKMVNVYKENISTKNSDLNSLKAAAQKLNTQFLSSGYDPSQTFDRFYVNNDGSDTYWIDRVVAYFISK